MITINKFITVEQAGRACLNRQLEIDEHDLQDYDRPLKKMTAKDMPNFFPTEASKHGFIKCMIKTMMP